MTHTNEQERAEFEKWYIDGARQNVPALKDWNDEEIRVSCMRPELGTYRIDSARVAWEAWQAARRAPVVPQGWKITEEMHVAAVKVLHRSAGVDGLPQRMTDAMLAAAPKQPEANSVELHQIKTAAPVVPQFSKVAKQKLDYLLEAGEEITGYAIQNKDGRRGAIDCHGFVVWWQDGAPVQMPEPVAYLYHDAPSIEAYIANERAGIPLNSSCISVRRMQHYRNETPLYTEQQVRDLLERQT